MKRIVTVLIIIALCLSLCACPATEQEVTPGIPQQETTQETTQETEPDTPQVHIVVGKVESGMTVKDVFAEVTIDNQPVACRVKLTGFVWDGYWEMAEDEPVPEPFAVRVDIFYSLPKGCDVEDVNITMDSDGGSYDGTGSISNDAQGNVEAWSRAFYGKEPLPPETESTEHTHSWTELAGPSILDCNLDRIKTFQCSCGETKTETIPAPGHDLKDWSVTPATCTEAGRKTTSCKHCGAGFTVELSALGHAWSAWVKKTGLVHSRTCSVCGAEETANHNIPSGEVTCTDCGADIIN